MQCMGRVGPLKLGLCSSDESINIELPVFLFTKFRTLHMMNLGTTTFKNGLLDEYLSGIAKLKMYTN